MVIVPSKEMYKANPERFKEATKRYNAKHPERRAEIIKRMRAKYKAEGKCPDCGRKLIDGAQGSKTCIVCLERSYQNRALRKGGF